MRQAKLLSFAIVDGDAAAVLAVAGEIDSATRDERVDTALALLQRADALVIDLAGVPSMDTVGVATLIQIHSAATQRGRPMWITAMQPSVAKALSTADMGALILHRPIGTIRVADGQRRVFTLKPRARRTPN